MDIGDIGFLIIAFIVFVVNFILKANKEKTGNETQVPPQPELPEPWEMIDPLPPLFEFPKTDNKKSADSTKRTLKEEVLSAHTPQTIEQYAKTYEEGVPSLSESQLYDFSVAPISDEEVEETPSINIHELFSGNIAEDLKKGIIYSEILNRKYD